MRDKLVSRESKVRVLVMGAGLIGCRHVQAIQAHQGCDLVGVIDPDLLRHVDSSVNYYLNLDEIIDPVDAVIIATPTELHLENSIEAVSRGWHLLIEKPVTATVADAKKLQQAVQANGVQCLIGHHRRYHPSIKKLRQLINDGQIGFPITSTMIWAVRKPDEYFKESWRQSNGSPVMINLIHEIDLLRYVLGEIETITGLSSSHIRNQSRTESGAVALRFTSGCCATISFADTAPSPWGFEAATDENPNIAASLQDMWWITGSKGGVAFPSLEIWNGANDWSQVPDKKQISTDKVIPLGAQLNHFLNVISGKAKPLIDIPDALESLRVTKNLEELLREAIASQVCLTT